MSEFELALWAVTGYLTFGALIEIKDYFNRQCLKAHLERRQRRLKSVKPIMPEPYANKKSPQA